MSECQIDSSGMTGAQNVEAETTLQDMMTAARSALAVTIERAEHMLHSVGWTKEMTEEYAQSLRTSDMTSPKPVSSGSDAFMWTYQQLSSTDWSGPPETNSLSTSLETAGKLETSEGSGSKSSASVGHLETLMNAFMSMGEQDEEASARTFHNQLVLWLSKTPSQPCE